MATLRNTDTKFCAMEIVKLISINNKVLKKGIIVKN